MTGSGGVTEHVWLLYHHSDGDRDLWGIFSASEKAVAYLRRQLPQIQWIEAPRALVVQKDREDYWTLHPQFYVMRAPVDPEYKPWPWDPVVGATAMAGDGVVA